MTEKWIRAALAEFGPSDTSSSPLPPPKQWVAVLVQEIDALLAKIDANDATAKSKPEGAATADEMTTRSLIIARGCGWPGLSPPLDPRWKGTWPGARRQLRGLACGWLLAARHWLGADLRIHGLHFQPLALEREAEILADTFREGGCQCHRRRVWLDDLEAGAPVALDHNAEQRCLRCLSDHHLVGWNPAECSFENVVAQAMKGPMRGFNSGAFEGSMIFDMLYWNYDLRCGNLWEWVCPSEVPKHANQSVKGEKCVECEPIRGFDPTLHRGQKRRSQFFIQVKHGGSHVLEDFRNCQICKNVYSAKIRACPLLGCGVVPKANVQPMELARFVGIQQEDANAPLHGDESRERQLAAEATAGLPDAELSCIERGLRLAEEAWAADGSDNLPGEGWMALCDEFATFARREPAIRIDVIREVLRGIHAEKELAPNEPLGADDDVCIQRIAQLLRAFLLVTIEGVPKAQVTETLQFDDEDERRDLEARLSAWLNQDGHNLQSL